MAAYPDGVKVFIDDTDVTKFVFGADTVTLTDAKHMFDNIDISAFVGTPVEHTITIIFASCFVRVEARLEMG